MGFAPTPGRVQLLDLASGPGVRIDRGISTGDVIPPDFDSMVAKVIAHGRDRNEAIARLRRALRESTAMIEDGTTNRAFLLALLDRPEFRSRRGRHQLARPARHVRRDGVLARRRRGAAAGGDRAGRRGDGPRAGELLRLRPPWAPAERGAGVPRRRGPPPRPGLSHRRLPARARPLPLRGRRSRAGGRRRAPQPARAAHQHRRRDAPHADLPPGHRPAGRGAWRAAPHRARRRRLRAQPRARGRRGHPGQRGRRGGRGRRRGHRRVDEDGDVADRAVRRAGAPRPLGHERAGGRADAAAAARAGGGRGGRAERRPRRLRARRRQRGGCRGRAGAAALDAAGLRRQRRRDAPRAGHPARGRRPARAAGGRAPPARPVQRRAGALACPP